MIRLGTLINMMFVEMRVGSEILNLSVVVNKTHALLRAESTGIFITVGMDQNKFH